MHVRLLGPCFKTGRMETTTAVMRWGFLQTSLCPPGVGSCCSHDLPPPPATVRLVYALAAYPLLGIKAVIPWPGYETRLKQLSKQLPPSPSRAITLPPLQLLTALWRQCTPLGSEFESQSHPSTGILRNTTPTPRLNSPTSSQLH